MLILVCFRKSNMCNKNIHLHIYHNILIYDKQIWYKTYVHKKYPDPFIETYHRSK